MSGERGPERKRKVFHPACYRKSRWVTEAPCAGLAILVAADAAAHAGHGPQTFQWVDLLPGPDLAISLVALGLAMGRLDSDGVKAPVGALAGFMAAGLLAGFALHAYVPVSARALPLLLGGVLLLDPGNRLGSAARYAFAAVSFAAGVLWGHDIPAVSGWPVFLGASAVGGLLAALAGYYLWQRTYQPWYRIALRILGSWMAAIGIMLLGASLR